MKADLKVIRDTYTDKSTIGRLYINDIFFCDTLEDKVRDLNKDGDLDDKSEEKIYGETAIPSGIYKMILSVSNRFKKLMPEILNVKNFSGIRIHNGNVAGDSHGCIIVGLTRGKDFVGQSRDAFSKLMGELDKYKEFEITIIDKK